MPDLKPFIVSGLALGGVYALSGVGLVVLFRATAVLNFAYGATGAIAAFVSWQLLQDGVPNGVAYTVGILAAVVVSVVYGVIVNPWLSGREPTIRAMGTLGYALALLGAMVLIWSTESRSLTLPSDNVGFAVSTARVTLTQIIALALAIAAVLGSTIYFRRALSGTNMRALACDRELSAVLGVPTKRLEFVTWASVGALSGVSGLLFADLVSLDASSLTFLVVASFAAGVIGMFRVIWLTLAGGLVIGLVQACATPFASVSNYRDAAPFVVAIIVLLAADRIRGASDTRAV